MATQTTPFRPGQTVRFAKPVSDAETALRFVVVELRGDRVLVEHALMGGPMVGQTVYALSDICTVSELETALTYREAINNADTIEQLRIICTDMIGNPSLCDDEENARFDMLDYIDEWIGDIQRRNAAV